jgi:hypothetical protein
MPKTNKDRATVTNVSPLDFLNEEKYLTRGQAAALMGCAYSHLNNLASRGQGPDYYTFMGKVRYKKEDILKYLDKEKVMKVKGEQTYS